MDSNTPHNIYDAEGSHYSGSYLMLPWFSKDTHSIHRCIGWCVWSTTSTGTWWNWIPNNILVSHLHRNTKEVKYPRTGSLQSILCHHQIELLPSRSWHQSLLGLQTTSQIPKWKECHSKVNRWGLELATYNIMFELISGAWNKAADCLSRLVTLLNVSKATVVMLTATNSDGPAFNTGSNTAQQCQTTMDTEPSSTQSIKKPVTPDLTTVETAQDITPKPLTAERNEALL